MTTLINEEVIDRYLNNFKEDDPQQLDKILYDYICFIESFSIEKANWRLSFDIISLDFSLFDKSYVDLWTYISEGRNKDEIRNNLDGSIINKWFFKENLNMYPNWSKNNFFGVDPKRIDLVYSYYENERLNDLTLRASSCEAQPSSYLFNIILSYGLHRNIMVPSKKSNQLLLILPIYFWDKEVIFSNVDIISEKLFKEFNVRLVKNTKTHGLYDMVLGDFDTIKVFHEYNLFYFDNTLIKIANIKKLKRLMVFLESFVKKRYFLGNFLFRLTVPESRLEDMYSILRNEEKNPLIPLYILDTQAFLSTILE